MNGSARWSIAVLVTVVAAVATGTAGAGKHGPAPGVAIGRPGVLATDGSTRYVAVRDGRSTAVVAIGRSGAVLRRTTLPGAFGVPRVAYDGSTAGLSHDGATLVLAMPTPVKTLRAVSRFAVVDARTGGLRQLITLRGSWSFDALSPDGSKLYLVEYVPGLDARYRVRRYDLTRGRLVREVVVDPRRGGRSMSGEPITRLDGPGGVWAYTLYRKPGGMPFIHALNTRTARALCIDLPWESAQDGLWNVRMAVVEGGRALELRQPRVGRLALVDTRRFSVTALASPQA